jgi:hypothetical protein
MYLYDNRSHENKHGTAIGIILKCYMMYLAKKKKKNKRKAIPVAGHEGP